MGITVDKILGEPLSHKHNVSDIEGIIPSSGDMTKSVYDTDNDGIVDASETVSDGTNTSTALEVKTAINQSHTHSNKIELDKITDGDHDVRTDNPHNVTKSQIGLGNVTNDAQIPLSQKGTANGVAELDENGKILSSQLPSYVDDVLEYDDLSSFPETGETGKIYIALDTNLSYRWSGTTYVEISPSLALGETSSTAYRGDRGKVAYDHSQLTSGNPHNVTKADLGLENVDNTSDLDKPISTATQTALNLKANQSDLDSHINNTSNPHNVTANQVLPSQSGNAGKFLTTNGTNVSWEVAGGSDPTLPSTAPIIYDDFFAQSTETGEIGELGWSFANGSIVATSSSANRPGVITLRSGTTANQVAYMYLSASASTPSFLKSEFDTVYFSVSLVTTGTDFSVKFGLSDNVSSNPPAN
jgi:hypothetical protein